MGEVFSSLRTREEEEAALRQLMQFAVQLFVTLKDEKEGGKNKYGREILRTTPLSAQISGPTFLSFAPENHNESQRPPHTAGTGHGGYILFGIYVFFFFQVSTRYG